MIAVRNVSFDNIRAAWTALEERGEVPTVFQTLDWIESWDRHIGSARGRTILLAAYDGAEVVGIAPLSIGRMRLKGIPLFRVLRLAGSGESDYQALVLARGREEEVLRAILGAIQRLPWDIAWLSDLHPETAAAQLLPGLLVGNGTPFVEREHTPCPHVPLPGSYEEYLAGLSRNSRRNLTKYCNRVERSGEIRYRSMRDPDEIREGMETFFRLHQERWRRAGEPGALADPALRAFHAEAALRLARHLDLKLLTIDGRPVATVYSYDYAGNRCVYLPGMDLDYEHLSLGYVMTAWGIRDAIASGLREYDFLRGDEAYKFHFTTIVRTNRRIFAARNRLALSAFLRLEGIR